MSGGMGGGEAGVDPPTTTKGDVSGFDTSYARIPIGTNNQVLTADSTEALGLKWATAAGGYLAPTLGGTVINSGATVSDLTSLSLSSANNIAWNVTTSGVDIDFSEPDIQTISIAATTTFTTSNRAVGKTKTLRIITDGVTRTMNFPSDWKWIGVKPTEQPLDSTGLLKLINYGTTDAFIVASYQVQEGGVTNYKYLKTIALSSANHILELTTGLEDYDNVWIQYYLEYGTGGTFEPQFNVYQTGGALAGSLGVATSINGAAMTFTNGASTVPINSGTTSSVSANTMQGNIIINNSNGSNRTDPPAARYGGVMGENQMMLAGTSNAPASYSNWAMKLADTVQVIGFQFRNSATTSNTMAYDSYANIYVGRYIS